MQLPILTCAVVPAEADAGAIGGLLLGTARTPLTTVPRPGPWCLVQLYDTMALVPTEGAAWLGDYERCLAWAWLESGTQTDERRH